MEVNTAGPGCLHLQQRQKHSASSKASAIPDRLRSTSTLEDYSGYLWTAHTRFPTNTPGWWGGAHPFGILDWTVVHNGEISSYGTNRRYLEMQGYHCTMQTDTEVMAYAADSLMRRHKLPVEMGGKIMAPPLWNEIERMSPKERLLDSLTLRRVYSGLLVNGPFTVIIAHQGEMIGLTDRIRLAPFERGGPGQPALPVLGRSANPAGQPATRVRLAAVRRRAHRRPAGRAASPRRSRARQAGSAPRPKHTDHGTGVQPGRSGRGGAVLMLNIDSTLLIDAAGMPYRDLNARLREAVAEGVRSIELHNVCGQRYIGTDLHQPVEIHLHGTPGNDLAAFMDGPRIVVRGNAQDGCGNTMNDGELIIHGRAGDATGHAMRGGKIFIRDDVGYRAAIHMKEYKEKRPMIVIGGTAQHFLGEYMAGRCFGGAWAHPHARRAAHRRASSAPACTAASFTSAESSPTTS